MTDRLDRLSEETLSSLVGINRNRRRAWAERRLLRLARRGEGYDREDAIELGAFHALVTALGIDDAVHAWRDVRPAIGKSHRRSRLLVVYDEQEKVGQLLHEVRELSRHVLGGHRVRVLDLTSGANDAARAFDTVVSNQRRYRRRRGNPSRQRPGAAVK
jgi:hypothetical protein